MARMNKELVVEETGCVLRSLCPSRSGGEGLSHPYHTPPTPGIHNSSPPSNFSPCPYPHSEKNNETGLLCTVAEPCTERGPHEADLREGEEAVQGGQTADHAAEGGVVGVGEILGGNGMKDRGRLHNRHIRFHEKLNCTKTRSLKRMVARTYFVCRYEWD